jgi:hypothetical protein
VSRAFLFYKNRNLIPPSHNMNNRKFSQEKSDKKSAVIKFLALSIGLAVAGVSPLGSFSALAATQTWAGVTSGTWEKATN